MSILKSLTESIIKIIQNNNVYINREVLDALIEHRNKSETLIALQEQHLNKIKTELAEKELILDELRIHMETLEVEIKRLRGISNTEKLPPENRKINLFFKKTNNEDDFSELTMELLGSDDIASHAKDEETKMQELADNFKKEVEELGGSCEIELYKQCEGAWITRIWSFEKSTDDNDF